MEHDCAKIIGISRHRLSTDGDGVTTLVAFHACSLDCKYCLNPQSLGSDEGFKAYTPEELYDITKIDELYFLATKGGITFGGGEPCLRVNFIKRFRALCGDEWQINLETALNVPTSHFEELLSICNTLIIDVKDLNNDIYRSYTGRENTFLLENLQSIVRHRRQADCLMRLPLIRDYNTEADREKSRATLEKMGFTRFDLFTYIIKKPSS